MAMGGRNRTRRHLDIWAGYVDVLSTLLMVIIFTLMVFVIGQFFLNGEHLVIETIVVEKALFEVLPHAFGQLAQEKTRY